MVNERVCGEGFQSGRGSLQSQQEFAQSEKESSQTVRES